MCFFKISLQPLVFREAYCVLAGVKDAKLQPLPTQSFSFIHLALKDNMSLSNNTDRQIK